MLTHASLFTGIGGFDLAAEWAGWQNIFQVEIDKKAQQVLQKHFPNVQRYADIKQFNGTPYNGAIDVLTGGFPCQPFSVAGKRKGTEDDRALWPEMLRVIQQVNPTWVVAENVYGLLSQQGGMVFEQVLSDLENIGYETQPFVIPASGKNAWHKRDRVWIVAQNTNYATHGNAQTTRRNGQYRNACTTNKIQHVANLHRTRELQPQGGKQKIGNRVSNCLENVINVNGKRLQKPGQTNAPKLPTQSTTGLYNRTEQRDRWNQPWIEVATALCRMDDGIPGRVDRLKQLGNAIVPQVAFEIFQAINYAETSPTK